MATLLTLCEDLLQHIGRQTSIHEQKALRSVCRDVRHAVEPLLFTATPIVVDMSLEKSLAQLETLANGQSKGHQWLGWRISLKNIRTGEWTIQSTDTAEAKSTIMAFLKTIDSLEDFTLVDKSDTDAHYVFLDVSSNLRRLSVTVETSLTPESLRSNCYPTALHWMGMIVGKSPQLEQLVPPSRYAWSTICPILHSADIHLKQISGACATEELLAYLASYSGLEYLTIASDTGKEALAHAFFDSLLQHKDSLLALICPAYHEGEWCLGPYNLAIIFQLHALQSLEMSVNSYDIADNPNNIEASLDMAPEIPALRSICIRATPTVYSLYNACGRNRMAGQRIAQMNVDRVLTKYSESTDSTFFYYVDPWLSKAIYGLIIGP
ncbi:hypothetical protein DFH09DRAFT_1440973 [Mycena vulgaris]|nr:hypothetical protein DFH09DRAFT_1440973 [Mycena vulgaris]